MQRRHFLQAGASASALATLGLPSFAQAAGYPEHPLRIVVPYPPGGFNDTLARTLGQHLQTAWNQPVVVDNKPGGATLIGLDAAAKSPADGYTLVILPFSFAVNPAIFSKMPYDSDTAFAPITLAASTANLLVTAPDFPASNVKELVALAKSKPGGLSYASTGTGSSNHLSMEYFKQMAGVDLTHVPYKGSAPAVTDLLGGHVQVMFDNLSNVGPHVKAGKLKALAVTTPKRTDFAPGVPTVAESGVPGYEVGVWFGVAAPAGTPAPVVDKLRTEIVRILRLDEVREKFAALGVESIGSSTPEFEAHLKEQRTRWGKVVRDAGVRPE